MIYINCETDPKNCKVIFIAGSEQLIVANTGKPFDSKGIVAICRLGLSEKIRPEEIDDYGGKRGESLIEEICNETIKYRWRDRNNFAEDKRSEERTYVDYSGRFIYELLQNADDAMANNATTKVQYIGEKGLGFKSVLEITNNPQIFSGEYRFEFSQEKLRETLSSYDHLRDFANEDVLPIFRHPFWIDNKPDIVRILQEDEGYSTVIVLPFKDDEAKEKAYEYLRSFDFKTLLFVRNIEEVRITFKEENENTDIFLIREPINSSQDYEEKRYIFEVSSNTRTKEEHNFILWSKDFNISDEEGKGNVSIAVKTQDFKGFEPSRIENNKLFVFFPTEEDLPLNFILHATFDIDSNRKHINKDSQTYKPALDEIGTLIGSIINSRKYPPQDFINTFIPEDEPTHGIAKDIHERVKKALSDSRFIPVIGGGKEELYKPSEVRVWNYDFGEIVQRCIKNGILEPDIVKGFKLATPELNSLKIKHRRKAKLQELDAQQLENSEYVDILKGISIEKDVEPDLVESLIRLWVELYEKNKENEEIIESLLLVKIWKTKDGKFRALRDDVPLFYKAVEIGDYLPHDVLNEDIKSFLESDDLKETWKDIKDELRETKKVLFIDTDASKREAILSYIKNKDSDWWEIYGWDCLKDLKRVIKSEVNFEDKEAIHVPTKDGWKPAILTYAGNSWGVPKELEEFWANIEDRYILLDKDKWEIEIKDTEEWKEFLKNIGVSWIPKVWKIASSEYHNFDNYVRWYIDNWYPNSSYSYHKYSYHKRKLSQRENIMIEAFPECLHTVSDPVEQIRIGIQLHDASPYSSIIRFQLCTEEWITIKNRPKLEQKESFKPEEVTYTTDENVYHTWKLLIPIILLPKNLLSDIKKIDDMGFKKFPEETNWFSIIKNIGDKELTNFSLVKDAYINFSKYGERNDGSGIKLLTKSYKYKPIEEIVYIDKYIYSPLKEHGEYRDILFVLELDKAEDFSNKIGGAICPISKRVSITNVTFDEKCKTDPIGEVLFSAIQALIKKDFDFYGSTEKLKQLKQNFKIVTVKNLKLTCKLDNKPENIIKAPFYIDGEGKEILAEQGQEYKAIAEFIGRRDLEDTIDKLLRLKQKDEIIEFLKEKGISEDTIREIEDLKEEKESKSESVIEVLDSDETSSEMETSQPNTPNSGEIAEGGHTSTRGDKLTEWCLERDITKKSDSLERKRGQESREAGEKAEKFIKEQLEKHIKDEFEIIPRQKIDISHERNRSSSIIDFYLKSRTSEKEIFLEVKSIESGNTIYWSANQVVLAKEKGKQYILVCVDTTTGRVYYLSDPYNKLFRLYPEKIEIFIEVEALGQKKEIKLSNKKFDKQEWRELIDVSDEEWKELKPAFSPKKKFKIHIETGDFEFGIDKLIEDIKKPSDM